MAAPLSYSTNPSPSSKRHLDDLFLKWLERNNFRLEGITPFGNDLYEAISLGVYGTTEHYMTVRCQISMYLKSFPDEFINYVTPQTEERVKNRANSIRIDKMAGGALSVHAASKLYEINIAVLHAPNLATFFPSRNYFERTMYITFRNGEKYDYATYTGANAANQVHPKSMEKSEEARMQQAKEDDIKKREDEFKAWLSKEGYKIHQNGAVGDGILSSIATKCGSGLLGAIRGEIADYLEKNSHQFLDDFANDSQESFRKDLENIRCGRSSDLSLIATALCKMYNLRVVIVNPHPEESTTFGNAEGYVKEVIMAHCPSGSYIMLSRSEETAAQQQSEPTRKGNFKRKRGDDDSNETEMSSKKRRTVNRKDIQKKTRLDSAIANQDRRFRQKLKAEGYQVIEIAGDGNCLFSSLAQALKQESITQNEIPQQQLRNVIAEYIGNNIDEFAALWEGEIDDDLQHEWNELLLDGRWGGELAISAATKIFQVNIDVCQPPFAFTRLPLERRFEKTVHLSYHKTDHYNYLKIVAGSQTEDCERLESVHYDNDKNVKRNGQTKRLNDSEPIERTSKKTKIGFPNNFQLLKHIKPVEAKERPYFCRTCDKEFTAEKSLRKHTKKCKSFICPICSQEFKAKPLLNDHRRRNKECMHQCSKCDKKFVSTKLLSRHIRKHHLPKPFICDKCSPSRSFYIKSLLTEHNALFHSDDYPFACDICGKRFKMLSYVNKHKRLHKDELPYKCHLCKQAFRHPSTLRIHKIRHTGKKLHSCVDCDRSFPTRIGLNAHRMSGVHMMKTHACDECPKVFQCPADLKKHKIAAHHASLKIAKRCSNYLCLECKIDCINEATWKFHQEYSHSNYEGDERVEQAKKRMFGLNLDALNLKSEEEYRFFIQITQSGKDFKCCGFEFVDENALKEHLREFHWDHQAKSRSFHMTKLLRNLGETKEEVKKRLHEIHALSKKWFSILDDFRKVYLFVMVPKNRDQSISLWDYLNDCRNVFFVYVGKKGCWGGPSVSDHHLRVKNGTLAPQYVLDNGDFEAYHYSDIFIDKLNDGNGCARVDELEAKLILKLHIFCQLTGQDRMTQNLEVTPLLRIDEDVNLRDIRQEIDSCNGNLFALPEFAPKFKKLLKTPTKIISKKDRLRLHCEMCEITSKTLYKARTHRVNCKIENGRDLSLTDELYNVDPKEDIQLREKLSKMKANQCFNVYVLLGEKEQEKTKDYVGKCARGGVSGYHKKLDAPSSVKTLAKKGFTLIHHVSVICDSLSLLNATEIKMILVGIIRNNIGRISDSENINVYYQMLDLSANMSLDELDEVIEFAFSCQDKFLPENPPSFMLNVKEIGKPYEINFK